MAAHGRDAIVMRLKRIEGQVRGVIGMVEDDRYCIDIMTQIQAVKAALKRVEDELLKSHTAHCVEEAIRDGNAAAQRKKFAELAELLGKYRG
ncbi:MAG: metal-sensitive transcriptional regulator [Parvularculaceae bacterium]